MASLDTKYRSKSSSGRWRLVYEKPVTQVSTALLFTVGTIVLFAVFAIRPTLITITELLKEIEDRQAVKEVLDQKVAALATAQAEYVSVQTSLPLVEAGLPSQHNLDVLAAQVEGVASSLGTPLDSIQMSSIILNEAGDVLLSPEEIEAGGLAVLPFTVNLTASFEELDAFLDRLTNMERVIVSESINIDEDSQQLTSDEGIQMRLQLQAFYLPSELEGDNL